MCGRFSIEYSWQELHDALNLLVPSVPILDKEPQSRLDIRPTQTIDVLRKRDGAYEWAEMRWSFEPTWAKTPLINARSDKMAGRAWSQFSPAVIFASGFYEWPQKIDRMKPANYARYNFTITARPVMPLAALWAHTTTKKGVDVDTVVIGTTAPNPMFQKLPHHRMAAILTEDTFEAWMNSEPSDRQEILQPFPSQLMTGQRVEISEMMGTEELIPVGDPL